MKRGASSSDFFSGKDTINNFIKIASRDKITKTETMDVTQTEMRSGVFIMEARANFY